MSSGRTPSAVHPQLTHPCIVVATTHIKMLYKHYTPNGQSAALPPPLLFNKTCMEYTWCSCHLSVRRPWGKRSFLHPGTPYTRDVPSHSWTEVGIFFFRVRSKAFILPAVLELSALGQANSPSLTCPSCSNHFSVNKRCIKGMNNLFPPTLPIPSSLLLLVSECTRFWLCSPGPLLEPQLK